MWNRSRSGSDPIPSGDFRSGVSVGWFMLPYAVHVSIFLLYPLAMAAVLVFHKWNLYGPMRFVGLGNVKLLIHDPLVGRALINTLTFLLIHLPLQLALALGLAMLLNQPIRLRGLFRAAFFLPVIVSGVTVTILWNQLLSYEVGMLNRVLTGIGLGRAPWLVDPAWAMPSVALMATWKNVGFYVILFLAGLQTIPRSLYEVADLDGATPWQQFRAVTLPLLRPTTILVLILSTINGFQLFIEPYILTGGGPANRTLSGVLYLYKQGFDFGKMGYAATIGLAWALLIFAVVLIQRRILKDE